MKYFFEIFENIFKEIKNIIMDKKKNICLEVPYSQKDFAKKLGAKWDPIGKKWFVPGGLDINLFQRWLPSEKENLRAEYFYLAKTSTSCYRCGKNTEVNAIILPEDFESVDENAIEDLEEKGVSIKTTPFCSNNYSSLLSYVTYISSEAFEEINKYTNYTYSKEYSVTAGYSYYRSLCQHCNAAQGDNYIIAEFDSAFFPVNIDEFERISFHKIPKYIAVRAGGGSVGYGSDNQFRMSNIYKV